MNIDSLGGRRFLLCVGCGLVCSFLLYMGKLSDGSFAFLISNTLCAYIGANTYQKHVETRADVQVQIAKVQADAPPPQTVQQVAA